MKRKHTHARPAGVDPAAVVTVEPVEEIARLLEDLALLLAGTASRMDRISRALREQQERAEG